MLTVIMIRTSSLEREKEKGKILFMKKKINIWQERKKNLKS